MPRQKYIKKGVIMPKKGEGIDSLISYDIPVHKHMEGQKQELGSLYRDMVELSPDGIVTTDSRGVVTSCNTAITRMLGYSRDYLVGGHFAKLGVLRLKDVPKYLKLLKDVLGGKVGEPIEVAIQRKDKTLFIADVRVNVLRVGGKTVLQAAVRDITERKQMESEIQGKNEQLDAQNEELRSANEELQATEEELRATNEELRASNGELQTALNKLKEANAYSEGLLKSMVDGLSVLDLEGRVIDINDALQGMLGLKKEEVLGQPMVQLLGPMVEPAEIEKVSATIGQLMAGAPARSIEIVIATKYGTRVTLSVAPSVVRDDKGKPIMLFAVVMDITERKRMESEIQEKNEQLDAQNEELRSANEELQATEEELRATNEELQSANDELREAQEKLIRTEKLAAIGQLASGVGHELRNPLGAIKNAVFYVRRRIGNTDLPATEPRVMEFLDIMDEEVNTANKVITDLLGFSRVAKPTVSPVSIAGVIEDALKHNPLPENIKLTSVIDENLPMVMVDADQVRQVFINIVLNAIQAMTDGGRLDIQAKSEGEFVEVEFSDSGSGIPKSAIKKIFDPLFTTKAKGIGLGLSVCKTILERHGGDIRVESKVGRGSTFTVSLPTR
jgi:PAS domain S-box-containing protein